MYISGYHTCLKTKAKKLKEGRRRSFHVHASKRTIRQRIWSYVFTTLSRAYARSYTLFNTITYILYLFNIIHENSYSIQLKKENLRNFLQREREFLHAHDDIISRLLCASLRAGLCVFFSPIVLSPGVVFVTLVDE